MAKFLEKIKGLTGIDDRYSIYYCDFETVIVDSQHCVICYGIVGKDTIYSNHIKELNSNATNNIEKSNLLLEDFLKKCSELVQYNANR